MSKLRLGRGKSSYENGCGTKILLFKKLGRPPAEVKKDAGRPSKVIEMHEKKSTLRSLYEGLPNQEKLRLEDYCRSRPLGDAIKRLSLDYLTSISRLISSSDGIKLLESLVKSLLKPVGEGCLKITERNHHQLPQEMKANWERYKWYYSFDWLLEIIEALREEGVRKEKEIEILMMLEKRIEPLETVPAEELASIICGRMLKGERRYGLSRRHKH